MKKLWLRLAAGVILFSACSPGVGRIETKTISTFDAKTNSNALEFFGSPSDRPFDTMIRTLDKAQKEIRLFAFHLTDADLAQSLIRARQRGVRVRVIAERKSFLDPRTNRTMDLLEESGIEIAKSTRFFSITHAKSFIVDSKLALISTMNMHSTSKEFIDFGVVTKDEEIISEMISVFEADWRNASENTGVTPFLKNKSLLFSPANSKEKLISLIRSAKTEIIVGVENLSHPEIINALVEGAARRLIVKVLTPECTIGASPGHNIEPIKKLGRAGIQARVLPKPSVSGANYWHAKVVIVDQKRIYIGSENLTENSLEEAREIGIIMEDPGVILRVLRQFENSWKKSISLDEQYVSRALWCK